MRLLRPLCEEFGKSVHGIDTSLKVIGKNCDVCPPGERPKTSSTMEKSLMIKIDGMLLWKQYMPKKHVRWGIKIWCL